MTSRRRLALKQRVRVLDPFGIAKLPAELKRAGFNPLASLTEDTVIEAAAQIADALVVVSGKDIHWDETARNFIEGLIIHLVTDPYYKGRVHLGMVRELLGEAGEQGRLKDEMLANGAAGGIVQQAAKDFFDRASNERMGVLSSARRHLKFLDYPQIRGVLERHDFELADAGMLDVALLLGPLHGPLHRCNQVPSRTGFERYRVVVHPLLNVVRAQIIGGQSRIDRLAKGFEPVLVPPVRVGGSVLLRPIQKLIDDDDDKRIVRDGQHRSRCFGSLLHEAVIGLERGRLVVAEIDLLAVNLDVPQTTGGTKKRFGKVRH
jgi:hypothetical protein